MNSADKLYLRNGGGKVFGPVSFSTLQQWVCDGRVEPTAELSEDLENWVAAPNIPGLGMEWVVENNPGQFYGPTHRAVIDDFIKSGSLVPGARFYRDMRSGLAEKAEFEAAAQAQQQTAENEIKALRTTAAEVDSLRGKLAAATTEGQRISGELAELTAAKAAAENSLQETRGALQVLSLDRDALLVEVESLRPQSQQLEELKHKLGLAQEEVSSLKAANVVLEKARTEEAAKAAGTRENLDATQAEMAALREFQEKTEQECCKIQSQMTQVQLAREEAEANLSKVRQNYETLTAEAQELKATLAEAERAKATVAAEMAEKIKELEAARAELATVQKARDEFKSELDALKNVPEKREEILVPEVIIADEPPPKPTTKFAHPSGGASPLGGLFGGSVSSLADLERQAQAELARMRAQGGKGFFGFGKKK